jgi:hypothetical protein
MNINECPGTYQSKVIAKVKVIKMKVKVMVPNERSCHKEPASEI